jgi:predicted nucleotidyltransferase
MQPSPFPFPPKRTYCGANIPMRVIRRYARAITEEFHPDKIILFGSYAYGTPHEDSDVDLLVVMPAHNQHSQAVRILWRLAAPFPIDLLVRAPKEMEWRLREGESFTTTIVSKGKVLYEKNDQGAVTSSARTGQREYAPVNSSGGVPVIASRQSAESGTRNGERRR